MLGSRSLTCVYSRLAVFARSFAITTIPESYASLLLLSRPEFSLAVAELLALRLKGMIAYLADIKAQYEDRKDHLGMVDELFLNLAHRIPHKR